MTANLTPIEVLDRMHAAILSADYTELARLTPALEDSLAALDGLRQPALLRQIAAKADRNAACLLAAGRGVRAAQRRLKELRERGQGFSTYDGRGKRAQHGLPTTMALRF